MSLAELPYYRGDTKGAIAGLRRLESQDWADGDISFLRSRLLFLLAEIGQFEKAFALIPRLPDLWRGYQRGYLNESLAPEQRKRDELAEDLKVAVARRTQAQTPDQEYATSLSLIGVALQADSLDLARRAVETMQQLPVDAYPRNIFSYIAFARVALADNKPEDALRYLREAERLGTRHRIDADIPARTCTARAYGMLRRYDDAAREYGEILRIYAGHYIAEYELAQVYDEMGRPADAVEYYARFLDHWSDADPGLAQVQHGKERLALLKSAP